MTKNFGICSSVRLMTLFSLIFVLSACSIRGSLFQPKTNEQGEAELETGVNFSLAPGSSSTSTTRLTDAEFKTDRNGRVYQPVAGNCRNYVDHQTRSQVTHQFCLKNNSWVQTYPVAEVANVPSSNQLGTSAVSTSTITLPAVQRDSQGNPYRDFANGCRNYLDNATLNQVVVQYCLRNGNWVRTTN